MIRTSPMRTAGIGRIAKELSSASIKDAAASMTGAYRKIRYDSNLRQVTIDKAASIGNHDTVKRVALFTVVAASNAVVTPIDRISSQAYWACLVSSRRQILVSRIGNPATAAANTTTQAPVEISV